MKIYPHWNKSICSVCYKIPFLSGQINKQTSPFIYVHYVLMCVLSLFFHQQILFSFASKKSNREYLQPNRAVSYLPKHFWLNFFPIPIKTNPKNNPIDSYIEPEATNKNSSFCFSRPLNNCAASQNYPYFDSLY